jgi:hypothetical protein
LAGREWPVNTSSSSVGILKIVVWDILVFASAATNKIKSGGVKYIHAVEA